MLNGGFGLTNTNPANMSSLGQLKKQKSRKYIKEKFSDHKNPKSYLIIN